MGRCLDALVTSSWPPKLIGNMIGPVFADRLDECPRLIGWSYWYWIFRDEENGLRCLIGRSYFNEPTPNGDVEIGYEVLHEFQNAGYATEGIRTLVAWAFSHVEVSRVIADTYPLASIRVLQKNGFSIAANGPRNNNMIRMELTRFQFEKFYPDAPVFKCNFHKQDRKSPSFLPWYWCKRLLRIQ